jgi:hypothetical protein
MSFIVCWTCFMIISSKFNKQWKTCVSNQISIIVRNETMLNGQKWSAHYLRAVLEPPPPTRVINCQMSETVNFFFCHERGFTIVTRAATTLMPWLWRHLQHSCWQLIEPTVSTWTWVSSGMLLDWLQTNFLLSFLSEQPNASLASPLHRVQFAFVFITSFEWWSFALVSQ